MVKNLYESLALAIFLIAGVMWVLFRGFKMIVISLLPNLIPLVITAGIMGFFGIPLKPSTILIFSIAMGISSDQTIYFITRYRQELKGYYPRNRYQYDLYRNSIVFRFRDIRVFNLWQHKGFWNFTFRNLICCHCE
jgi:predicted RND superfamily exporter protein